ncbi:pre-16S rRNA-processing nuclease YqgF [Myxosarcina sp. GI1]|uniref:pre-16S rRNA-processing nuclease YqgF n=1 Tax=Myxosarcina sp. GI1 TaxID=1541065 RepID=UPI00056000BA|nr:pre-16S rRNA-processing nuclease YqgF [Myxosarcina sp. GI1]
MNADNYLLGFDPGRDKCGIAVTETNGRIVYHQVIESSLAIATIDRLCQQFSIITIVIGNGTTAKSWQHDIEANLSEAIEVIAVDEKNSTLEARDRYWSIYPPQGLQKLIPKGMRLPPRPVDDIVAILLIERYLGLPS